MNRLAALVLFHTLLLTTLPAQVVRQDGDPDRIVRVFDLSALLDHLDRREPNSVEKGLAPAELRPHHRDEVLLAVRRFAVPPLGEGDLVQALGSDAMVARVRLQQAAWIDRFLTGVAAAELDVVLMEKVTASTVPGTAFLDWLGIRQDAAAGGVVALALGGDDADARREALGKLGKTENRCFAAHLPIQQGSMAVGSGIKVVLGYDDVSVDGGDVVLVPRTDELFDGFRFRLQRVALPDGTEGYGVEAEFGQVRQPIPTKEVETSSGKRRVHLPEASVTRIDLSTPAASGTKAVVFARRKGDDWLVVVVESMKSRKLR